MATPMAYPHSPFVYHHVPNTPFLQPPMLQTAQSPAPFVPDIENQRNNRHSTDGQHLSGGRNVTTGAAYTINPNLGSPTPVVPSISAPPTPQPHPAVSSTLHKEQVVPHFSPLVKKERDSLKRKGRRLDTSPGQSTVPEINLFSGDEIFA